jgi:hypothetical protein
MHIKVQNLFYAFALQPELDRLLAYEEGKIVEIIMAHKRNCARDGTIIALV